MLYLKLPRKQAFGTPNLGQLVTRVNNIERRRKCSNNKGRLTRNWRARYLLSWHISSDHMKVVCVERFGIIEVYGIAPHYPRLGLSRHQRVVLLHTHIGPFLNEKDFPHKRRKRVSPQEWGSARLRADQEMEDFLRSLRSSLGKKLDLIAQEVKKLQKKDAEADIRRERVRLLLVLEGIESVLLRMEHREYGNPPVQPRLAVIEANIAA